MRQPAQALKALEERYFQSHEFMALIAKRSHLHLIYVSIWLLFHLIQIGSTLFLEYPCPSIMIFLTSFECHLKIAS